MGYAAGDKITATEFNDLVVLTNKYWADNVVSAAVTDSDRSLHKYGWGQTPALEIGGSNNQRVTGHVDCANPGDNIQAVHMNQLVARANASGCHLGLSTDLSYKIIDNTVLSADATAVNTRFSAATIDNGLTDSRSAQIRGDHTIGAGMSSSNVLGSDSRTTNWQEILISDTKYTFTNYDHARYFFNSGGALTVDIDISGAVSTPSQNWAANLASMGTFHFLADDTVVSGTGGYSAADRGFYNLTNNYQLLYSFSFGNGVGTGTFSGTPFSGGDVDVGSPSNAEQRGGYLYGGTYAINRISLYGKYSSTGEQVDLRVYLQSPDTETIDGTITQTAGYVVADNCTKSGGTGAATASATFNVSSYIPTHSFTNTLTSTDDF